MPWYGAIAGCHGKVPLLDAMVGASSNDTPPNGTHRWHPAMAPYHMPPSNDGTLPWHPASSNGTQQWHPPWHPAMAPDHGTLPWQPAMAPSSSLPKCVITTPRLLGLLHPAMAPYHMASSNAYQMAPINGIQQWRLTMASSNGSRQWLVRCHSWVP